MKKTRIFFAVFLELFPKFSDFVISDDCIGKILSKSIRIYPFFFNEKCFFFDQKNEKFR